MISIIVATDNNRVIGGVNGANEMPWHISEDLKRFKRITSGHPVIMGRRTYESLGRPLPNRTNVVVTRDPNLKIDGVTIVDSIEKAIELFPKEEEIFIIGGGTIYAQTIDIADKLYITHVDQANDGETLFPIIDTSIWKETFREEHDGFAFVDYERR